MRISIRQNVAKCLCSCHLSLWSGACVSCFSLKTHVENVFVLLMFLPLSSLNDYSRKSKNICLASALPNHLYMTSHGDDKNCLKYS